MSNYRDIFLENTYYLVSNKWFNGSVLFENSDDYKAFMLYVIENLLEYKWLILSAYALLPDHFHLVIKNCNEWYDLSDFMRKLQVSYAMFNKKVKQNPDSRWLPVFEWRFRASIIPDDKIEHIESCVSYDPENHGFIEDISWRPYTSVHQVENTWYDYMTQTHIRVYNEWRNIKKKFFSAEEHPL